MEALQERCKDAAETEGGERLSVLFNHPELQHDAALAAAYTFDPAAQTDLADSLIELLGGWLTLPDCPKYLAAIISLIRRIPPSTTTEHRERLKLRLAKLATAGGLGASLAEEALEAALTKWQGKLTLDDVLLGILLKSSRPVVAGAAAHAFADRHSAVPLVEPNCRKS